MDTTVGYHRVSEGQMASPVARLIGVGVLLGVLVGCVLKDTADTSQSGTDPTGTLPTGGDDCDVALPVSAEVVSGSAVYNSPGAVAWVCGGGEVTDNGSKASFFLEDGATLTVNGSGARVYMKSGSTALVNGTGATVYMEAGATLTANSSGHSLFDCGAVTFDAGAVTGGGC